MVVAKNMPPRSAGRAGDAAPAAPTTPVRTPGASREIVHLSSSTPGKKRAVGNGGSPSVYGVHAKHLSSKFVGQRKSGNNMVVILVYRVDDINDEIVVDHLPTCLQAMVKWNGTGTSKIAYNWKLKKEKEGIEITTLLHSTFNGMVRVTLQCTVRNQCSLSLDSLHKFYGDHRYSVRQQVVEEGKCFILPNTFVSCADFADDNGDRLFKDPKSTTWASLEKFYRSDKNDLGATFNEQWWRNARMVGPVMTLDVHHSWNPSTSVTIFGPETLRSRLLMRGSAVRGPRLIDTSRRGARDLSCLHGRDCAARKVRASASEVKGGGGYDHPLITHGPVFQRDRRIIESLIPETLFRSNPLAEAVRAAQEFRYQSLPFSN